MESRATFNRHLKKDALLIGATTIAAILITKSGALSLAFLISAESELIGAFIAGILFTSLFTTPFAIAMFLSLAPDMNPFLMVGIGSTGAILGDLVLFALTRHTFADDVDYLLKKKRVLHRFAAVFHRRVFRWIIPFVGALIIASPLPDELGLALMGVSRMKVTTLVGISFVMNALGITIIALAA